MALINVMKIGVDGLQIEHDSSSDSINMADYQLTGVSLNGTTGDTVLGTDKTQFTNFSPVADSINSALLAIDSALGDIQDSEDSSYSTFTNGEALPISKGEVVYLSGNDTVMLAKNDDDGKDDPVAIVRDASVAASAQGTFFTSGRCEGAITGATAGTKYFLDSTSGAMTTTVPTTSGKNVVLMGYALNATDLLLRPQIIGKRA